MTRAWLYPTWSGSLTGAIMGESALGTQAAAYVQLTYLGWITAGSSMSGNLMVAGIYGATLTTLFDADLKLVASPVVTLSLLGVLVNQAYMILNSVQVHRVDKYLEEGNLKGVCLTNCVPPGILSFILYGISVMLMILYEAQWVQDTLATIPQWPVDALNLAGMIMPALSIAMLLNYLRKKKLIAFFFFGFFATVYLELDAMSLFILSAVIIAVMYFFSRDHEEGGV